MKDKLTDILPFHIPKLPRGVIAYGDMKELQSMELVSMK